MSSTAGTAESTSIQKPNASLEHVLNKSWKVDAAGLALIGLLALGGYFAGLGPYLGAKLEKASHDLALADARSQRDAARADAEAFAKQLAEKRDLTKSVEVQLKSVQERHSHVGAVSRLAAESGLMVDQVSPGETETIANVQSVVLVPMTLGGKGSYSNVSQFLHRLHEQFPDTAVGSVKLLAEPGTDGQVAVFSVSLLWFANPDSPTGTSGATVRPPG